jgi:hypothetical protein
MSVNAVAGPLQDTREFVVSGQPLNLTEKPDPQKARPIRPAYEFSLRARSSSPPRRSAAEPQAFSLSAVSYQLLAVGVWATGFAGSRRAYGAKSSRPAKNLIISSTETQRNSRNRGAFVSWDYASSPGSRTEATEGTEARLPEGSRQCSHSPEVSPQTDRENLTSQGLRP